MFESNSIPLTDQHHSMDKISQFYAWSKTHIRHSPENQDKGQSLKTQLSSFASRFAAERV